MSHGIQLIELIRELEQRRHVFLQDPMQVTRRLAASDTPHVERLYLRAQQIDQDQQLQRQLARVSQRIQRVSRWVTLLWLVLGAVGVWLLLQSDQVNFFAVLFAILGMHTLLLLVWLLTFWIKRRQVATLPHWVLKRLPQDTVSQALASFWTQRFLRGRERWLGFRLSHQLWFASLLGVLIGLLVLLVTRQYSFSWQSTLLDTSTLVWMVQVLSWLPAQVGFAVPDAAAVASSRLVAPTEVARDWAGLLVGSIVCYGLIPRGLLWLLCWWMQRRPESLDLNASYYQKILKRWQRRELVDPDDSPVLPVSLAKSQINSIHPRLACLLDTPLEDVTAGWSEHVLGMDWPMQSAIMDREQLTELLAYLAAHPVQLLVGLRLHILPDRGVLRRLEQLEQAAAGGVIVALISTGDADPVRREQWQTALTERGLEMTFLNVKPSDEAIACNP
ncbi:MAG: DUF2868 domain-containing protein [Pseudomonadota bacterium]|nr:DUF2868 domain-containing protein [Pseudomonadota bacterium]